MRYLHSLAFRLTLLYAGIFAMCFAVVFGIFYFIMQADLNRWIDEELREGVKEIRKAYESSGILGVRSILDREAATEDGRFLGRIVDGNGTVIYETEGQLKDIPLSMELAGAASSGMEQSESVRVEGDRIRTIYTPLEKGVLVQIGLPPSEHELWMEGFSRDLLKVGLIAVILSVGVGVLLARRSLLPVREMVRMASGISALSLGKRMPMSGRSAELDQLAVAFNSMMERIDTLVKGIREVTENLAHDLRTPIAGIRGLAEITLNENRTRDEYKLTLYQIMERMDCLLSVCNSVLDESEADAGALALHCETVSISELCHSIIQTFEPVAADAGQKLASSITSGLTLKGDRGRLFQVLANLVDNAIKYTTAGGTILLYADRSTAGDEIVMIVADSGAGIPEQDLPHIFERYYRGEKIRCGSGTGLGLPLVQGIVKAHGGQVMVRSEVGKGSMFLVVLPIDEEHASCELSSATETADPQPRFEFAKTCS